MSCHWDGDDLILTLRVQPRADRDQLSLRGGEIKARITAPPVDGKANAHLLAFLAASCGVAKSRVTLLAGHGGRSKRVRIEAPARLPPPLDRLAPPGTNR